MICIGIDPGKHGAIAIIDPGTINRLDGSSTITERGELVIHPMPLIQASTGNGRDEYDPGTIAGIFRTLAEDTAEANLFVVVEKPMPMPPKFRVAGGGERSSSGLAQFNRGVQFGFAWMLEALRIPYQLVHPRTWQRVMHEGTPGADTKQRSILAAQRLFPGVDLRRSDRARKQDHGFADALLLAEYARRTKYGRAR